MSDTRAVRRAAKAAETAREKLAGAIHAARDAGVPWVELAEASGMDRNAMRSLLWELIPETRPASVQHRYENRAQGPRRRTDPLPGVSIPAAARAIGVSPGVIYRRVESGEWAERVQALEVTTAAGEKREVVRVIDPEIVAQVQK